MNTNRLTTTLKKLSASLIVLILWQAASLSAALDDFDDNDLDLSLWTVVSAGGEGGTVSEMNQQLSVAGGAIGQWYNRGVTSRLSTLFTLPSDGCTLEQSVDLVQGGQVNSWALVGFTVSPGTYYLIAKDEGRIALAKSGGNFFFEDTTPLKNDNVKLVLALKGVGSSVFITTRVLDLENGNAVLFERTVEDTASQDPMVQGSDSPPGSLVGLQGGMAMSLWYNHNTGADSELIFDNACVVLRGPEIAIEQAITLIWPVTETAFVLEGAPTVDGPWDVVDGMSTQVEHHYQMTLPTPLGELMTVFRLRKP